MISITISDGKYTFQKDDDDHRIHILRYGMPFVVITNGSNAILALMQELEEIKNNKDEE